MERLRANTPLGKKEKCQLAKFLNISEKKVVDWFHHQHRKKKGDKSFSKREWSFVISVHKGQ